MVGEGPPSTSLFILEKTWIQTFVGMTGGAARESVSTRVGVNWWLNVSDPRDALPKPRIYIAASEETLLAAPVWDGRVGRAEGHAGFVPRNMA
jgi:hypothetical protein